MTRIWFWDYIRDPNNNFDKEQVENCLVGCPHTYGFKCDCLAMNGILDLTNCEFCYRLAWKEEN